MSSQASNMSEMKVLFSLLWIKSGCCWSAKGQNSEITLMAAPNTMIAWLLFSNPVVSPAATLPAEVHPEKLIWLPAVCWVSSQAGTKMLVLAKWTGLFGKVVSCSVSNQHRQCFCEVSASFSTSKGLLWICITKKSTATSTSSFQWTNNQ